MTKKKQIPRLMRSELLGRIYIVTKYEDLGKGDYIADEKYDVTEEFEILALKWIQSY